jgi:hypothetical protein
LGRAVAATRSRPRRPALAARTMAPPLRLRLGAARGAVARFAAGRQQQLHRRALFSTGGAPAGNPLLYGTTEPPLPPPEVLTYGGLSVEVVPNVGVGSVTYAGAEICRGINFLFRDEGWGTPPLVLESSMIVRPEDKTIAQTVSWTSTVQFKGDEIITFDAQVAVGPSACGSGAPTLSVDVTAEIIEACKTARFGFIVLHPLKNLVGAERNVFCAMPFKTKSIVYQDRLGTDIGKVATRTRFCRRGRGCYPRGRQRGRGGLPSVHPAGPSLHRHRGARARGAQNAVF